MECDEGKGKRLCLYRKWSNPITKWQCLFHIQNIVFQVSILIIQRENKQGRDLYTIFEHDWCECVCKYYKYLITVGKCKVLEKFGRRYWGCYWGKYRIEEEAVWKAKSERIGEGRKKEEKRQLITEKIRERKYVVADVLCKDIWKMNFTSGGSLI